MAQSLYAMTDRVKLFLLEGSLTFGERLEQAYRTAGFTQTELADRAGVRQSTISDWKTGKVEPSFSELVKVLDVLYAQGVSMAFVFLGRGPLLRVEPGPAQRQLEAIRQLTRADEDT